MVQTLLNEIVILMRFPVRNKPPTTATVRVRVTKSIHELGLNLLHWPLQFSGK
jgi:hypothetical protein